VSAPPQPPVAEVVGAVLVDDLESPTVVLAARRTEPPHLAGGWELPGGKVDPGESREGALHRELREELGVDVELGEPVLGPVRDGLWPMGERFVMAVWWARVIRGVPHPIEDHDELRWLGADTLHTVAWLPADRPIVDVIRDVLEATGRKRT
jgi:8-oxo-dGTP diphosphatase